MNFLGDPKKPLIVIDTPGLNDIDMEKRLKHRADLEKKLAAMQRVDLVLILMNNSCLGCGRLNEGTQDMIADVISVFGGNKNLVNHFAVAFSMCDESDDRWTMDLEENEKEWQVTFEKFFGLDKQNSNDSINDDFKSECKIDMSRLDDKKHKVPMYYLSNIQGNEQKIENTGNKKWSQFEDFELLYKLCVDSSKDPLYCCNYTLMTKFRRAIKQEMQVRRHLYGT